MAETEDIETLRARLAQYKSQAVQLAALLASDPSNSDFGKLQSDLQEAIAVTSELIKFQEKSAATLPTEPPPPMPAEVPVKVMEGAYVSAFYSEEGCARNAIVKKLTPQGTCIISFVGYGDNKRESEIMPLKHPLVPDANLLQPGASCSAVYGVDNLWYPAEVKAEIAGGEYSVTFTGYGNTETVNQYCIIPLVDAGSAAASGAGAGASYQSHKPKAKFGSGTGDGTKGGDAVGNKRGEPESMHLLQIPEHLKILPTDSEEQKAKKRKQVHAIKGTNRLKMAEAKREEKKSTWQNFQKKAKPKGLSVIKKGSMFATPDNPEAKVGVVGSGRGVTEYQGPTRYQHNFEESHGDDA